MSCDDDYAAIDFGWILFVIIPTISIILANIGYLIFEDLGFWIGLILCPFCCIIYLFWVICFDDKRE